MKRLILIAVAVMAVVAFAGVPAFAFGGSFVPTQAEESDLEMLYQEALHKLEGEGDFEGAVALFERVAKKAEEVSAIGARALLQKGKALERLGRTDDAVEAYRAAQAMAGSDVAEAAHRALVRAGAADGQRQVSDDERLEARLEMRVPTFDFPQTSLEIMVSILRQLDDGLNIVVSPNVATDEQISLVLTNTTIADILSHVTRMTGLDWTVWKGAVYISDQNDINSIEREKAAEEVRPTVAEVVAPGPGLERLTVDAELLAAVQSLFKARMEAARNEVRRATELHGEGRAPMSEVENAQLKVMEAAVALRALARASDAEMRSLLAGTLAGGADVKSLLDAATADVSKPSAGIPDAKTDYRPIPGAEEVILYDVRIANFAGAQLFDLDSGKSIPYRGGRTDFFAENPGFDLCFTGHEVMVQVLGDTSLQDGAVILNNPCQAGFLPAGTDLAALPAGVSLPEVVFDHYIGTKDGRLFGPAQYMLRISELPFVLVTDRGRYLARVRRVNEDTLRLEYKKLEDLPGRAAALFAQWAEALRRRLDRRVADATKRRVDGGRNREFAGIIKRELEGHLQGLDRWQSLTSAAQRAAFAAYRGKVEAQIAELEAYWAGLQDMREVMLTPLGTAPSSLTALDLDVAQTMYASQGQGAKEFLAQTPSFDLAYMGNWREDVFIINKGLRVTSVGDLEEPPVVPEPFEYREPQALPKYFPEPGDAFRPGMNVPTGVSAYPDGYSIIVMGNFAVQTDSGEYVVHAPHGGGRVRYWKAMRPLDPEDIDIPPLPAELTVVPTASVSGEIHETTLADADLETPAPQGLDLDTGDTLSFPGKDDGIDQAEWYAAHPELDLFYDRQLVLMGADAQAALLPPGTDATSAALSEVTYNYGAATGDPRDIEGPGAYLAEHPRLGRFIVIEPGEHPIYVETAGGAYFIKVTSRADNHVTLVWQRLSRRR